MLRAINTSPKDLWWGLLFIPYPTHAHSVPSITSPSSFPTSHTISYTCSFSPLHHQPLLFLHQPLHILHMLIQPPPSPAPPLSPPATPYPAHAHSVPSITSPSSFSTSHTISYTCSFSLLHHQPLLFLHQPHHILHMLIQSPPSPAPPLSPPATPYPAHAWFPHLQNITGNKKYY